MNKICKAAKQRNFSERNQSFTIAETFSLEKDSMEVLFAIYHADWIIFPKCDFCHSELKRTSRQWLNIFESSQANCLPKV